MRIWRTYLLLLKCLVVGEEGLISYSNTTIKSVLEIPQRVRNRAHTGQINCEHIPMIRLITEENPCSGSEPRMINSSIASISSMIYHVFTDKKLEAGKSLLSYALNI